MNLRTVSLSNLCRNAFWVLFLVGCDSFTPEPESQVTFGVNKYYVVPGSSIVVDLKSVIKQSFTNVSLSISQNPTRGTLTQLDPFLLKYTPNLDFLEGTDQFVFSAAIDNGAAVKTEKTTIFMKDGISEFPCGIYPIEDYARVNPNGVTVVHPLRNDQICDVNGALNVLIYLGPNFGNAVVTGDSIMYTPGSSFSGIDELVYRTSSDQDDIVSYGIVSLSDRRIETFSIQTGFNDIFFVNDSVGFIAGGDLIYKTIDGGKSWVSLYYWTGEMDWINLNEIFFLDEYNGFVTFSKCVFSEDDYCVGGWFRTRNGGVTWERTNVEHPVKSIFFTSPLTGFISIATFDSSRPILANAVLKTVDGGQTWAEVFSKKPEGGDLKIRFASDKVGYAFEDRGIFVTSDGGQTWTESSKEYHSSFAVAPEDIICASFIQSKGSVMTPSVLVRSEGGNGWAPVVNFPYVILSQGFSPSGDLGVAVGMSGKDPMIDPESQLMTISTSVDKGKTWTNVPEELLFGFPKAMSVPSSEVVYILCSDRIIKYSR